MTEVCKIVQCTIWYWTIYIGICVFICEYVTLDPRVWQFLKAVPISELFHSNLSFKCAHTLYTENLLLAKKLCCLIYLSIMHTNCVCAIFWGVQIIFVCNYKRGLLTWVWVWVCVLLSFTKMFPNIIKMYRNLYGTSQICTSNLIWLYRFGRVFIPRPNKEWPENTSVLPV